MSYQVIDTRALAELRRRVKKVDPVVRRELDRELRTIARVIAREASTNSVKRTGKFAAAWKPTVTVGRGVAVINRNPAAGTQEYGGKVWLRRGGRYVTSNPSSAIPDARGAKGAILPMRQATLRTLPNGSRVVQNEAQYLIRRSAPGRRAVIRAEATAIPAIGDAVERAISKAL